MSGPAFPIIFSGPMVRAILAGAKTQTRRIVRTVPGGCGEALVPLIGQGSCVYLGFDGVPGLGWRPYGGSQTVPWPTERIGEACPYGGPGDRLWVREAFAEVHPLQVAAGRESRAGRAGIPGPPRVDYRLVYRADGEFSRIHFQRGKQEHPWRELCLPGCQRDHLHPEESWCGWRPSIFMPRWASRITLEVVAVRVERLQEISEADAQAEGIQRERGVVGQQVRPGPRDVFAAGWDSINGKRGPWSSNPFVWVITFRRAQP